MAKAEDREQDQEAAPVNNGGHQDSHDDDAKPLDKHPDGTPMTQDEIDTYWLQRVYKPHVPQLTPRAVVTGMLLGGVMSLSNLYVGLKTGWGLAVTVTAAVLAFGIFSGLKRVAPVGPFKRDFTSLENNTMASAASAAGYFTGAGLTSGIPALFMATGIQIVWWQLALWILAVSFLGVMLAVPMRRQMIDVDRLPFPEGIAYAETIRSLHAAPGEARKKALALLYGALAGGGMKLLSGVTGLQSGKKLDHPLVPEQLGEGFKWNKKWLGLTLGLQTDILMIGAGAMMGVRICLGLVLGAVVGWGVLGTWLHTHGLAGNAPSFATVRTWIVCPGVTIIVVNGLLAFGLKWRTAVAALAGLGKLARGTATASKTDEKAGPDDRPKTMAEVEVPAKWFIRGTIACVAFVVVLAKVFFNIPMWMGFLAAILSVLLSIVACRATGETSITPIGALGKITQFMYGGLAAGNIQTNLMTASITAGAAMHSADLLTDMKGGYILGSKPRSQFLSQFFGIVAGALFCIPAYAILATPERLGSPEFPAPAAKTWQAVAELLAGGINAELRGTTDGSPAKVSAVSVNLVPVGTVPGDEVTINAGVNAGSYKVAAVVDKSIVLEPNVPKPSALDPTVCVDSQGNPVEVPEDFKEDAPCPSGGERSKPVMLEVKGRASAKVTGPKKLSAVELSTVPNGTRKGDYLMATVDGHELWWGVKGVVGNKAVVDRNFTDTRVEPAKDLTGPLKFDVRKESLPPYAPMSVLIAGIIAVILTLLETYLPKKARAYVPSAAGLGLGFVVAGFDSISMFIGSLIAWYLEKRHKNFAEQFTLAGASGIMAGASLMGIVIIVLSQVIPLLATP
ncbi:MAG: OPT/YSL family transporter [Polyangiaceae bacterium]|nr:OPT/YSL family transporter [Polyangiaceae bacterium]